MIYIAIILIATGLSFTLLFETWLMKIIGALLCVLGTALLITYYLKLLAKRKENHAASLEEKEKQLRLEYEQQLANMKTQLKEKDNNVTSLNQQLQQLQPTPPELHGDLMERIQSLRSYFEDKGNLSKNYQRFFAELIRAAKYQALIKGINENFTEPLLDKIKDPGYTLDDTNQHYLLGKLMQLALVGIDFTNEFHTQQPDGYDSLAINVAAGKISQEEAANRAQKTSADIRETAKTIRVLNEMVQKLGLNDNALIINDTLLQE